jgi:hypothetical protein
MQSNNEEYGGPTFGAITARSYHTDGVHALLADSSVRFASITSTVVSGERWEPSPEARPSRREHSDHSFAS